MHSEGLYRALPFVYITIGLIVFLILDHPLATVSGTIFITAGILVGYWRYKYRKCISFRYRCNASNRNPVSKW